MLGGRLVALSVLFWVSMTPARAQRYAEVFGQILDPSEAAVAGAVVTVTDEDTGFRRQVLSESGGMYAVGALAPGSYKITVRKEGFGAVIQFGVKLTGAAATRHDFRLPVGAFADSIVVPGTAPMLDRQDASAGGRFEFEEVARLPLNGRGMLTLLELIPGTNVVPATRGDAGQFTTSGMRPNTNYFTVDGVSANVGVSAGGLPAQSTGGALPALSAFGSLDSIISIEAMQEFRVQTSTTVAEFGRMPGASIALNSRAGSEQFHGATAFRFRSQALNANDWFANRAGLSRAPLGYEDLAQTLGGPVKRNHTFFFLSYEHIWLNQPYVWEQPVPSLDTRQAVPANVRPLVNLFPAPNGAVLAGGCADWTGQIDRPAGLTAGSARIDQALTPRITIFGRYSDSPSHNDFGTPEVNHLDLRSQSLTLGMNVRTTARSVLDFRVNESQSSASSVWTDGPSSNASSCALQPLAAGFLGSVVPCDYLVRLNINGVGQLVSGKEGDRRQRQFQIVQTASLERGHHALKFGLDYRRMLAIRRDPTASLGLIADSILDLYSSQNWWVSKQAAVNQSVAVKEFSLWAQDTWQATGRLTVAAGMRWEFSPAPSLATPANFLNSVTGDVSVDPSRPLWPLTYGNFAPRLGLAYRLDKYGRTVLRAGAGLYYDSSVSIATDVINNGPLNGTSFTSGQFSPASAQLSYGFEPDLRLPQVIQWNVALEQGIGANDVVSLGYLGSTGNYLIRREVSNSTGLLNYVALTTNRAASDYDAMQLQYRRQVARGLDAAASYSWSHSLDNDSSDAFLLWSGLGASAAGDHASSDFDLRQTLTAAAGYEFPVRAARTAAGRLLGGWGIDAVAHARTGFPITVLGAEDIRGLSLVNAFRPNWVYGQPLWTDDSSAPGGRELNPSAFAPISTITAIGAQGSLGRNVPTGFGMWQVDLAVKREFRLADNRGLEVRLEAFNALNHANFGDPVKFLDSPVFGRSTSLLNMMLGTGSPGSGLAPVLQTGGPRSLQASIRFHF